MHTTFGLSILLALHAHVLTDHATSSEMHAHNKRESLSQLGAELTSQDVHAIGSIMRAGWRCEQHLRNDQYLFDYKCVEADEMQQVALNGLRSAVLLAQAHLRLYGIRTENQQIIYRELGRQVVKNALPRPVSFYVFGHYTDFSVHRLPLAHYKPELHIGGELIQQQHTLYQGMRWARAKIAHRVRQQVQSQPNTSIRDLKTGKPLKRFLGHHWAQLTWRLGYTTIFDLLREIVNYTHDYCDLDGGSQQLFIKTLLGVIEHLNALNERVIEDTIGVEAFEALRLESSSTRHHQEAALRRAA